MGRPPRPRRPHANTGKTALLANIPEHLRSPGRGHNLNRPYAWPGSEPPEIIPIRDAIPRWMRTTGCHWTEAAASCDVEHGTVRGWMTQGGRLARLIGAGNLEPTALTEYESLCLGFSADVQRAAAEVLTRWQSILERESRGGFLIGRTTVVEKVVLGQNGQPTGLVERTTTTVSEVARPDTMLLRWRMSKMHPRYRDRLDVGAADEVPDDDVDLAKSIAEDLRRFKGLAGDRVLDVTSTESEIVAPKALESPG